EENPYINPPKKAVPDASVSPSSTPASPAAIASIANITNDFITLENVVCIGSDGKSFERYDKIDIATDVERQAEKKHVSFTPYQAITHFENRGNGLFLPSFALSCNILAALFGKAVKKEKNDEYTTLDANLKKILDQYLNHGAGYGWHAQNTVVNWKTKEIIHYPKDADFPNNGGTSNINKTGAPIRKGFSPVGFGDMTLEKALKEAEFKKYIINLTGLPNPETLVEIGKYYTKVAGSDKKAFVWVPNKPAKADYTAAAWLGCDIDDFSINADDDLGGNNAARGVRSK
ncbi:hypothetical protein JW826_01905, partial [Candidatus Woesearchaeota archaeon]|nr:hypothetical protein [Candidatus Woesearchaeota archaeon]